MSKSTRNNLKLEEINLQNGPVTNLGIVSLPQFTNIHIKGDYYTSFRKVGDSIVLTNSRGNMRNYDVEGINRFNSLIEEFCIASGVKKPYVQIRDFEYLTGRIPFRSLQKQIRFFLDHQDELIGIVSINEPSWMAPFFNQGLRYVMPNFKYFSAINYAEAITSARKMLVKEVKNPTDKSTSLSHKALRFEDIQLKPEWIYSSDDTDFVMKIGGIPGQLMYISMHGTLKNSDDIENAFSLTKKVVKMNNLTGIPFIMVDYSEMLSVTSIHLRKQFAKEVEKTNMESDNLTATQLVINANWFNKTAIKTFSSFTKKSYIFVDTPEEAMEWINNSSGVVEKNPINKGLYVSAADLEELFYVMSSMQWEESGSISKVKVSPDNSLTYLVESLELIRNDINELRENERRTHIERLHESETNHINLLRMMEDIKLSRLQLEKSEESMRILLDNIQTQVWYLTDEHTYGAINKAHAEFNGVEIEDYAFRDMYDVLPTNIADIYGKSNKEIVAIGKAEHLEEWVPNAEGEKRLLAITKTPKFRSDGSVEYIVCSAEDITERKQAEDALRESEERFRFLVDYSYDMIWMLKSDGILSYVSPSLKTILGYEPSNIVNKSFHPLVHPEDLDELENYITRVADARKSLPRIQYRVKHADGTWRWHEGIISPVYDDNDSFQYFVGVSRDITEQKNSRDRLLNSEEKYRLLTTQMQLGMALHEIICNDEGVPVDYRFLSVNDSFERMTGLCKNDIIGKTVLEVLPKTEKHWIETYGQVALTRRAVQFVDYSVELGKYYSVSAYSTKTGRFAVIIDDVTQRRQFENELLVSEARLRSVIAVSNMGAWEYHRSKNYMWRSPECMMMLGYDPHQFSFNESSNLKEVWIDLLHPDDRPRAAQHFANYLETGSVGMYENIYRMRHADNSWVWVLSRGQTLSQSDGSLSDMTVGTHINITENKEKELALLEYKTTVEQSMDGIVYMNMDGIIRFVNRAWASSHGYDVEELIGQHFIVFFDTQEQWDKEGAPFIEKILATDFFENEVNHVCKDGTIRPMFMTTSVVLDKEGIKIGFIAVARDITDRKEMEQQLYKEKERFKTTLLSVGDGVISTDIQGNVAIMNKISEEFTGWTQEEAVGKSVEDSFIIINELTRKRCENPVKKVLAIGDVIMITNHAILVSKDGIERPVEYSAAPIKDEQSNITGVVLVFRDFTEKKKIQDEINYLSFHDYLTGLYNRRYYEEEMKRLNTKRNLPLTIVLGDVNGLKLINDSFGHATGDQLLIKAAEILKKGCRADDIISRIGGDEFVILLPKTDGHEAEKLIKRIQNLANKESIRDIEISISFGYATKTSVEEEIESIFKKAEDKMYNNKLFEGPSIRGRVIDNIIKALNKKNIREEAHSKRVSELCFKMGAALGLDEYKTKALKAVGLLHDIGKIAIADDILDKPGKLTDNEWAEMKRHSETGYRILSTDGGMAEMAEYVLAHHERWDGKGYPKGLTGEDIPLEARIIAIVDAYDAMTSDRSYRTALSDIDAVAELRKNAGIQFDPELVKVFVDIC